MAYIKFWLVFPSLSSLSMAHTCCFSKELCSQFPETHFIKFRSDNQKPVLRFETIKDFCLQQKIWLLYFLHLPRPYTNWRIIKDQPGVGLEMALCADGGIWIGFELHVNGGLGKVYTESRLTGAEQRTVQVCRQWHKSTLCWCLCFIHTPHGCIIYCDKWLE